MDIIDRLRGVSYFKNLSHQQLQALAASAHAQRFIAGEDIIQQGDLQSRFYIVDEGVIHFRKTDAEGFEHPAGAAHPGAHFGAKMFTTQEPAESTAEAVDAALLYIVERDAFDKLLQAQPELLRALPEIEAARRKLTLGFRWLTPGETVAFTAHRHWWTLLLLVLPPSLGLIVLGVLLYAINAFGILRGSNLPYWIGGGLMVLILIYMAWSIADWFDDDFIVTNKRVAHQEKVVFISETRDEIPIPKIQQLTATKGGALEVALNIGNLEIRSAGRADSKIVFDRVENPDKIKQIILQQQALLRAREQAVERERFRRRVAGELRHYVLKEPTAAEAKEKKGASTLKARLRRRQAQELWQRFFGYEMRLGNKVTWRKHWFVLWEQTRLPGLGLGGALVALVMYFSVPNVVPLAPVVFVAVWLVVFLAAAGAWLWEWEDWRNDLYEVDDRQVTDIERWPFGLNSRATVAPIGNVQDVKSKRPHLMNTLLNFGNVEIQVAGGGPPMIFYNVPRPEQIVEEIFRRIEASRVKKIERETGVQSRQIVDALIAYHRLLIAERHEPEQTGAAPAASTSAPPSQTPAPDRLARRQATEFPPIEVEEGDADAE